MIYTSRSETQTTTAFLLFCLPHVCYALGKTNRHISNELEDSAGGEVQLTIMEGLNIRATFPILGKRFCSINKVGSMSGDEIVDATSGDEHGRRYERG